MTDTISKERVIENAQNIYDMFVSNYGVSSVLALDMKTVLDSLRAALTEALAPQPVREPISDEQIRNLSALPECMYGDYLQSFPFARAIERAHHIGVKNEEN